MAISNKMIGEMLIEKNSLTQRHLDEALQLQKIKGERLGEVLLSLGYVEEDALLNTLSEAMGVPFWTDVDSQVDAGLMTRVPLPFIRKYRMVPIKRDDGHFVVAVQDPLNLHPLDDLRLLLGGPIRPVICRKDDIEKIISQYFEQQASSTEQMIEELGAEGDDQVDIISASYKEERDLLDLANEAPIIKFINVTISQAVKQRASDIHIEPLEKELRVRYRIDGVLYHVSSPPKSQQAAIISRIKIMANLNIAERRLPQDGRIKIRLAGREIDIRVSVIPTAYGERVVLRILDKGSYQFTLFDLGISEQELQTVDHIIKSSHGIILVTGPTGSGKTTTLYAALSKLNAMEVNIITVEDPIEYEIQGIAQIQVKPKIGLTFASGLRSILRQDPDVILVGEIRDFETAEMAIQASLTGHLVFSTLHTNDSSSAITRLINMGVEPFLVSSSVIAIMAQRLVRVICPHCKEQYTATPQELASIGLAGEEYINGASLYRGKGCEQCFERGYLGRTGIHELLLMTDEVQRMVLARTDSNEIKRAALRRGMVTLREDGARKCLAGITTIEEVLRVTREDIV